MGCYMAIFQYKIWGFGEDNKPTNDNSKTDKEHDSQQASSYDSHELGAFCCPMLMSIGAWFWCLNDGGC